MSVSTLPVIGVKPRCHGSTMLKLVVFFALFLTANAIAGDNKVAVMSVIPEYFTPPIAEDDFDKNFLSEITNYGWYNIHVAKEEALPPFSFSIGHFYKHNHPEMIVIGLSAEIAHKLLNTAAAQFVEKGSRIEPFKPYEGIVADMSVIFIPVDVKHYKEYLGYANWFYASALKPYPILQMVWPDSEGNFAWEEGFDVQFAKAQPILGPTP